MYLITYQRKFGHIPYPCRSYPKATVASGGCGPCATLNCVENMTSQRWKMADWIAYVIKNGGRIDGGTDIPAILNALKRDYGFSWRGETSVAKVRAHLKAGGMAVFHSGGKYSGWPGLLSDAGHFVCIAGLTSDGRAIVIDPGWYSGKYDGSWRRSLVQKGPQNGVLYISFANLEKDRKYKSDQAANYYLITAPTAKTAKNDESEENEVRYQRLDNIPDDYGFRGIIRKLMDIGAIGGDGSDKAGNNDVIDLSEDMVRMFVVNYRAGAYDRKLKEAGMTPAVAD